MMQICENGEYEWIKRKIEDGVKRYLKEVRGQRRQFGE
jgi:hypothetical protein